MSELGSSDDRPAPRKPPGLLAMGRMARRVHSLPCVMMIVVAGALLTGCPPPPLELDEPDAAPNAPPAILSVRNETGAEFAVGAMENIVLLPRGIDPSPSLMRLTLVDTDVLDTLYVRGFNDYNDVPPAQPARSSCSVSPSAEPSATRTVTCSLNSFCTAASEVAVRLDIVVSDRQPDDAGILVPTWYAVEAPGLQAFRVYEITCQDPS
jgi:hypothetical protein